MPRTAILALIAAVGLTACVDGPQTAAEVRTAAAGAMGTTKTFTTSRSLSSVTASLRSGASKCMNRAVTTRTSTPGAYGPVASAYTTDFRGTVTTSGNRSELAIHKEIRGNLPQPNGFMFVADAVAAGGGTQVTMYGGRFNYDDLFEAVEQWAKGGAIVCPKMPGT